MNADGIWLFMLSVFTLLQPMTTILPAQIAPSSPPPSLCRTEEQIIFSCTVDPGARIVSLCASGALDHRRGYVQYHFGKPGAVELQFPQARANTQIAFRYAHYFRGQIDRTEVSFDNQGYRYTVFDYYEGDIRPLTAVAGVRVTKLGARQPETELRCRDQALSKLGRLETVIARDPDNPLN
jgi:hypothetical protein